VILRAIVNQRCWHDCVLVGRPEVVALKRAQDVHHVLGKRQRVSLSQRCTDNLNLALLLLRVVHAGVYPKARQVRAAECNDIQCRPRLVLPALARRLVMSADETLSRDCERLRMIRMC